MKKTEFSLKNIIFLQIVIIIYTISGIAAKLAAAEPLFAWKFCMFYGVEIVILGVYALLWQQVIKRFELSAAYANRAMVLVWSLLWAVLIFHDRITWKNVCGTLLVIAGTVIINLDMGVEEK